LARGGSVAGRARRVNRSRRRVLDFGRNMARQFKIVVEKHSDGYIAYPLGMKGTVVGEGESYEDALANVKSAIRFHIETFGNEVLSEESPLIEAFIAEATIAA
jgi:predicted RNase H-like HicB family nuclease